MLPPSLVEGWVISLYSFSKVHSLFPILDPSFLYQYQYVKEEINELELSELQCTYVVKTLNTNKKNDWKIQEKKRQIRSLIGRTTSWIAVFWRKKKLVYCSFRKVDSRSVFVGTRISGHGLSKEGAAEEEHDFFFLFRIGRLQKKKKKRAKNSVG